MASGKTLELRKFSRRYLFRGRVRGSVVSAADRVPRDRSLRGKARIKARKARYRAW